MNFEIIACKEAKSIPLVVHIPHSSTIIPPEIRRTFCLDDDQLRLELLRMTDWYTDQLFHGAVKLGGSLFINRMSRLVVDPERFPDDNQEVMAEKGMGAVYTKTADGQYLRHPLSLEDRSRILDTYFYPYADAFADVVAGILNRHGRCVILDGHSFPSRPLPYEFDQDIQRPEICLGTDAFHTPESLIREVEAVCIGQGLRTERNRPFAGTYVPLHYWQKDPRVSSVMMEVRRDLYMDETAGLRRVQDLIQTVMERIAQI
jgi:N-formylglutamate deformylase